MDDIVSPLIVAAVSAVTYVAYKHPAAYRRIDRVLTLAYVVSVVCVVAFTLGVATGGYMVSIRLPQGGEEALKASQRDFREGLDRFLWPVLGVVFYSWFLSLLPRILGLKEDDTNDKRENKGS